MLKSGLCYFLLLTTALRFGDMLYLLITDNTGLPVPVLLVASAMIVYGVTLGIRKFIGVVRLRQVMTFYLVQTLMFLFNLAYIAFGSPLQVSLAETLLVGTFLDILINVGIVFFCFKQIRGGYAQLPKAALQESV